MAKEAVQTQIDAELSRFGSLLPATQPVMIPAPAATVDSLLRTTRAVKQVLDAMAGAGAVADRVLTVADLLPPGQTQLSLPDYSFSGGGGTPGGGGGGGELGYVDPRPVLSTPPTPTALTVTGTLKAVLLDWDLLDYRNHAYTEIWRATTNSLGSATLIGTSISLLYQDLAVAPSVTYYYWVRAVGYAPADGSLIFSAYNAVSGTPGGMGIVNGVDLGPLVVEAANLANGSVSAAKLAAQAVDLTKFANGIEPVGIYASVPSTKGPSDPNTIMVGGKLYRWNGSAYTAAVPSTDIAGLITDAQLAGIAASKVTGQLTDAQLAAISAAKITGQLTDAQLQEISAAKLTGQITSTQISDNSISTPKLQAASVLTNNLAAGAVTAEKIAAGTITATQIAAGSITGANIAADTITAANIAASAITATELAAGAVTTSKIAAGTIQASNIAAGTITGNEIAANSVSADRLISNSITAAQIQAGAIGTNQLAANAVTVGKLLVTGQGAALNDDPQFLDSDVAVVWPDYDSGGAHTFARVAVSGAPAGAWALQMGVQADGPGNKVSRRSRLFPIVQGKTYRISFWARRQSTQENRSFVRLHSCNSAGVPLNEFVSDLQPIREEPASGSFENFVIPEAWTRFRGRITPTNPAATQAFIEFYGSFEAIGQVLVQDLRCEEYIGADLIVDGTIAATKLMAGTITAGSGVIANGAITNAMIGNLAVDSAKIADGAIVTAKIGDAQITGAKIQDATITSAKIVTLDASKINTGTLNASITFAGILSAATGTFAGSLSAASGTFTGALVGATGTFAGSLSAATGTFSGSLSAATGTFAGSLSGASGTFGTITAGVLRNSIDTSRINLNASGAQDFLRAGNGAVRITADGDAYFTKSLASGTWSGSVPLIDVTPGFPPTYSTPEVVFDIDTGFSRPWGQLYERTMTARVGNTTVAYSFGESDGQYIGLLSLEASVVTYMPQFADPITTQIGNPYGANNSRVFIRIRVQLKDRDNKTAFNLTSLQWTLDTAG